IRKAVDLRRHETRGRRGSGRVLVLADLEDGEIESFLGSEPTPELAAQMADECRSLLDRLGDETLRSVALWKMEGHTNAGIAAKLGCVEQTVERKVRAIRRLWQATS